jgi:pimeloyl-ACP methyl ester carboxylesterase
MHRDGLGPSPIPLILTHGWPWTFWHWSKVIGPLADPAAFGADPADAFDVIVPSLLASVSLARWPASRTSTSGRSPTCGTP